MIAEGFVANGATVYLTGRNAADCDKAAVEMGALARHGASAHALPADLQRLDECRRVVAELSSRLPGGALDVLVNNAGAVWGESFDDYPDAAWAKVLTLNLQRAFTLTQLCAPLLEKAAAAANADKEGGGGDGGEPSRVIHIGSIDGLRVPPASNSFAYSASKAGLHHLSRALAAELGPRGVTSNVLACGPFPTKMMRATLEAAGDALLDVIPMRRLGRPADVAGAALFLASRAG